MTPHATAAAGRPRAGLSWLATILLLNACAAAGPQGQERLAPYRQALAATAPAAAPLALEQARARYADFYAHFTAEQVRRDGPQVFAPDAYLNDQIRELHGAAAITDYLARQADGFVDASFVVEDAAVAGGEYYFRWIMTFRLAGSPDEPEVAAAGMSHVRFDAQGRIQFQVDYWDTASSVYERVPVLGGLLRWVKQRL